MVATEEEITIGDLAKIIINAINPNAKIICEEVRLRPQKSEVERLLGSNKKILAATNWQQQYSLKEGIQETIKWFQNNSSKYKSGIYNV